MKIENADINTIKPYENNPRKLKDSAIEKVAMSLKEYGFRQPIVSTGTRVKISAATSSDSRAVSTFEATPSCSAKSSKRLMPLKALRMMTNFHLSANCSAACAIGQSMSANEIRVIVFSMFRFLDSISAL